MAGTEKLTYGPIVTLLTRCQQDFPASNTIAFQDTHARYLTGPTEYDHITAPDILGGYPGLPAPPSNAGWDQYALPIEVKLEADPVDPTSNVVSATGTNVSTIAQLVKSARSLLFASSHCYVFVIGIYSKSHRMRIYRFDRSGSVSCGFDYHDKPLAIREFLWRLVNPLHGIPNTVTMREEVKRFDSSVVLNKSNCRWVKVRLNRDTFLSRRISANSSSGSANLPYYDVEGFTFGPALYKSSGLFSRATYVTRILVDDAWHQRVRRPESEFYERIQERYAELRTKPEFDWVRQIYPDVDSVPDWIPGLPEYYGYLDLANLESTSGTDSERGHTTVTFRLQNQNETSERSRGRSLTGPVGRPLVDYPTTKDLVVAVRDAVAFHCSVCGVLHRDISTGNILFVEVSGRLRGFLHDFDYATFVPCDFGLARPEDLVVLNTQKNPDKELTGTPQFMAIEILAKQAQMHLSEEDIPEEELLKLTHMAHHDLESFYWVMVWILLRYANHNHRHGDKACTKLFDHADNEDAKAYKENWLYIPKSEPLTIIKNEPLNAVRPLFMDDIYTTHSEFIEALTKTANASSWPTNDSKLHIEQPGPRQDAIDTSGVSRVASRRSSRLTSVSTPDEGMDAGEVALQTAANIPLPQSLASEPPQSSDNPSARRSIRIAMNRISAQIDSPGPVYALKRRSSAVNEDGSPRKRRRQSGSRRSDRE
ncbi:hypothetical protein BDQ17DRAFT_1366860 [Cyathus striatus]|nr:hypothetical protein BDQ17DRAFT_1366860 [Cyathus striatus]